MKFCFFADGTVVILLALVTVFCDQDLHVEILGTEGNKTMEVPCSLDDSEGNVTLCENMTHTTRSPELQRMSKSNPSDDITSTPCPPEGCSVRYEPESNTSFEVLPESAQTNFSETFNLMENNETTEHPIITTDILSNETVTSILCPPEGCSMNASEISPDNSVINHSTTLLNETTEIENSSTSKSVFMTGINDTDEVVTEWHGNSSFPHPENISMTDEVITASTISSDFSNSSEGNFSEVSHYSDNPSVTTISSLTPTSHMEENDTITDNHSSTEYNVSSSDQFSNISDVTNSSEMVTLTETWDIFNNTYNTTFQDSIVPSSTIKPTNESSISIPEFTTENITVDSSFTDFQPVDNFTTNATFAPDDSTSYFNMSYTSNTSDSVTETSTWTVTGNTDSSTDTSSELVVETTTDMDVTSTESPLTPHRTIYLVVELRINCSGNKQEREIALSVAQLLNATLKDSYGKNCSNLHNVTLAISHDLTDFATIYRLLSKKLKNAELIRIIYDDNSANTTSKNITVPDSNVTENEMILYITLGVCLGAVFLIALAIICFKCFRRRPSKPVDLDVPHLNLRLEDYTLTRIPRPNTVYLDYFRGPIVSDRYSTAPLGNSMNPTTEGNRGLVQPFDTSVVPLEDAKKLDGLTTSPGRTSSTCPSTPLRTFGRKDWKHGDNLIYENVISSSTEKLHPDFYKYGYPGMENPTFAA